MFLEQISNEVESWKNDSAPFISDPLNGRFMPRSVAYGFVHLLMDRFFLLKDKHDRKPVIGFCFNDPKNWILTTVAAQLAGVIAVPIPREFTLRQISSFVPNLDLVLTDSVEATDRLGSLFESKAEARTLSLGNLHLHELETQIPQGAQLKLPSDAVVVIHTSGSTDNPKGVVVSERGLWCVIETMRDRMRPLKNVHYASVLPMSLLLEQVLGVFIPVMTKGSVSVLPSETDCYTGTQSSLDLYIATIQRSEANFSMVPPSFLAELCKLAQVSMKEPRCYLGQKLQVLATGGAPIDRACLEYLKNHGLEVFQGYGLSENTSVVAWTYPGPNSLGSVGQPLAHNKVRISNDGRIEVSGPSVFLGYVSGGSFRPREGDWLDTGDNGYFDNDGCLHVTGRDSNLIVLSSGRNVAPEWIESKFKAIPSVKEVLVIGHGRPFLSALVLVDKGYSCENALSELEQFAKQIENEIPDFSRIRKFHALPFNDRYYSVSGRVLRKQVLESHKDAVEEIYFSAKQGSEQ